MSFKKFDGSTWQAINPKKLKGVPYTGTLPAVLTGTKAEYLHRYKIYGNTEQIGTPTPENPIEPQECGERTENLFDVEKITHNGYSKNNFYDQVSSNNICAVIKRFEPNTNYYIMWDFSSTSTAGVYDQLRLYAGTALIGYVSNGMVINLTQEQIDSITNVIAYFGSGNTDGYFKNFTIIQGSTAPSSYIPYGYKLPLTSGSTPVDIYIGESQTTRRIKKLVLTGNETWQKSNTYIGSFYAYLYTVAPDVIPYSPIVCTHATDGSETYQRGNVAVDGNSLKLWLFDSDVTAATFRAYLRQQYAAGTPVTVWCVLAEPETGIVNEPLRKIGDYADTIDSTQTTAQIPTSAGATTIGWAGSGLAPSEFDSIQEWVDIPTYTYTNGAWGEDN